ncbi:MAG TPA: TonB-dependent receptor [Caulobacteraceae bacterium]|nr:TonB-dependent receptor [Caulobacteraceae bacterium]
MKSAWARALMGGAALTALLLASRGEAQVVGTMASVRQSSSPAATTTEPTASGAVTLGEVVVTAEKRSEKLEHTPVAITAVTATTIAQAGITGPRQLQESVPSMTFSEEAGFAFITIRGLGGTLTTTSGQSSVASYIDGVYIGNEVAEDMPSFDVDRIEVLRGPQGTLYGRNADGGVVNYITALPSFDPGATASVTYGNYNAVGIDVGATGPLSDQIAARASFHYDDHDGYRYDIATGQHYDAETDYSGRVSLLYKPNDSFSVVLQGDDTHETNSNPWELISQYTLSGQVSQATPLGVFSLPAADLVGLLSPSDLAKLNGGSIASYYGLVQAGPPAPNPNESLNLSDTWPPLFVLDSGGGSATIDWNAGPANVKSITAYRYDRLWFSYDFTGEGFPNVVFDPAIQSDKQFTQEFDISGDSFGHKLTWVAGAFYLHTDSSYYTTIYLPAYGEYFDAANTLATAPGSPYPYSLEPGYNPQFYTQFQSIYSTVTMPGPDYVTGSPLTPNVSTPSTAFIGVADAQKTQSIAGFAQATYKITDALRMTGGFRWTNDTIGVVQSFHSNLLYTLTQLYGLPPSAVGLCNQVAAGKTWNAPTGTVGLDYDAGPDVLTYAKASWGYKSGGFNSGACATSFDPEHLTDYEGGVKAVFAGGQILTNAALYYYDYSNIQFETYVDDSASILNAGSATALGLELEYIVQPRGLPGFEVDGSVSYEDSQYGAGCFQDPALLLEPAPTAGQKVCANPLEQIKGNELIGAPKWKSNVGVQYTTSAGRGSLMLRGEASWTDTIYYDIFDGKAPDEADTTQPPYWIVNARLVWTSANGRYVAELFGRNLTNSLYAYFRTAANTPVALDTVAGQFAPPRTFGVKFTYMLGSEVR